MGITGNSIKIGGKKQSTVSPQRPVRTKPVPKKSPTSKRVAVAPTKVKAKPPPAKVRSIREIALAELAKEEDPNRSGATMVRFNHYQKTFHVKNGVLQWKDVDEEYSFSFVYRGTYTKKIFHLPNPDPFGRPLLNHGVEPGGKGPLYMQHDEEVEYFICLVPTEQYRVEVEEGEEGIGAEGLTIRDGPLLASEAETGGPKAGNAAVQDITNELLKMDVKDLHNAEAQRLKEARDLEDVLFS